MKNVMQLAFGLLVIVTVPLWLPAWFALIVFRNLVVQLWPGQLGVIWQRSAIVLWLTVVPFGVGCAWSVVVSRLLLAPGDLAGSALVAVLGVGVMVSYLYLFFTKPLRHPQWVAFVAEQHLFLQDLLIEWVMAKLELRLWWRQTTRRWQQQWEQMQSRVREGGWRAMFDEMGEGIVGAVIGLVILVMSIYIILFTLALVVIAMALMTLFAYFRAPGRGGKSLPKPGNLRWFGAPSDGRWLDAYHYWLYQLETGTGWSLTTSPPRLWAGAVLLTLVPAVGIGVPLALLVPGGGTWLVVLVVGGIIVGSVTGWQLSRPAGHWFDLSNSGGGSEDVQTVTLGDWLEDERR